MKDPELPAFQVLLKRLLVTTGKRVDAGDWNPLLQSYFKAFSNLSLADLERGADAWIAKETKFPKPAEWRKAIPVQRHTLPEMSEAESALYLEAERQCWEREPCQCGPCRAAGVDWKPQRFVPNDREQPVQHPKTKLTTLAGHWAHGAELQRWYHARGIYLTTMQEKFGAIVDLVKPKPARKRAALELVVKA